VVSDGKETCQGDPVVAARALAAKGTTVHTVGFVVDTAARGQLQAIARATGGTYFDAPVGPELRRPRGDGVEAEDFRAFLCRDPRLLPLQAGSFPAGIHSPFRTMLVA
jgi:Ca-activated chloride channel family protein